MTWFKVLKPHGQTTTLRLRALRREWEHRQATHRGRANSVSVVDTLEQEGEGWKCKLCGHRINTYGGARRHVYRKHRPDCSCYSP